MAKAKNKGSKLQPDTRMLWMRLPDAALPAPREPLDVLEVELASEAEVTGEVEAAGGTLWMRPLSFPGPDARGLYRYALRVPQLPAAQGQDEQATSEDATYGLPGTKDGYLIRGGVAAELAALISLTLQARVFVAAITMRRIDICGERPCSRAEGSLPAQRVNPLIDGVVFDNSRKRSFTDVTDMLERLRTVPPKHHLALAVAAERYAAALRFIGVDEELVVINLVSAIERLCEHEPIADDPLRGFSVERVAHPDLTPDQRAVIESFLKHRSIGRRFTSFLVSHSVDFFDNEKRTPEHTQVTPANLAQVAKAIYAARSGYLHAGDPMYISQRFPQFPDWHMDPTDAMQLGDRRFDTSQKLPRVDFIHRLVRHCILRRINDLRPKNAVRPKAG